jgi:hypothetical protein
MSYHLICLSGPKNSSNFLRSFSLDEKEPKNHGKIKLHNVFNMINDLPSVDLNGTE